MTGNAEILVHVSAPATRRTDELYRALTEAYLDFESCPPLGLDRQKSEDEALDSDKPSVATGPLAQDAALDITDISFQANGGISFGNFPSHLAFESQDANSQASIFSARGESIADSLLDSSRFGQLEKIQRRWKQGTSIPTSIAGDQGPTSKGTAQTPRSEIPFIESTQFAAQDIESQLVEDISFLPEDTDASRRSVALHSGSHVILPIKNTSASHPRATLVSSDPRPHLPPSWGSSFVTGTIDEGRLSPARKADMSVILVPMSRVTSQIPSARRDETSFNASRHSTSMSLSALPFEIFAPAPKVSTESPESLPSQVTKYLRVILEQNPGRFKPSESARLLDRDERGYWSLVCSNWPRQAQLDFWTSLLKDVCAGRWGWGITAHRISESVGNVEVHALGEVRIYCWGEIVEHVWVALWLCSKGRVSGSGLKWIDADDSVVIETL